MGGQTWCPCLYSTKACISAVILWLFETIESLQKPILAPEHTERVLSSLKVKWLSRVQLFATQWTVGHQAPPFMGFSRQEHWSGLPFPSPGDLPNSGIKPESPHCRQMLLPSEPPGKSTKFNKAT